MENLFQLLDQYSQIIMLGLIAIMMLQFILIIVAFISLTKTKKKYKIMMRGTDNKNLESVVTNYLDKIDEVNLNTQNLVEENKRLENKIRECVQKVGVVRYKAFDNVGSDLSFSVALLDENNDGLILTGLYGRDHTPTYAKPVNNGESKYQLSEEEKSALMQAINK